MNENVNNTTNLQDTAVAAIAATTKTPFQTAFKITMGIGLAHATMLVGVILVLMVAFKLLF